MGSCDPRAYSRNKRGIAGSLIWISFDRHALLDLFYKSGGKFLADVDEIRPQFQDQGAASVFASSIVRPVGPSVGSTIDQLDTLSLSGATSIKQAASAWYSDQVLPFDVTLRRQRIRRDCRFEGPRHRDPERRLGHLDR